MQRCLRTLPTSSTTLSITMLNNYYCLTCRPKTQLFNVHNVCVCVPTGNFVCVLRILLYIANQYLNVIPDFLSISNRGSCS